MQCIVISKEKVYFDTRLMKNILTVKDVLQLISNMKRQFKSECNLSQDSYFNWHTGDFNICRKRENVKLDFMHFM